MKCCRKCEMTAYCIAKSTKLNLNRNHNILFKIIKEMIRLTIVLVLIQIQNLNAQDFQGIATYVTNRKLDIKLDNTSANSDLQKQIHEMMKKQFQKEYNLVFDKTTSVYKKEENLGVPQPSSNIQIVVGGSGGSNILYKNSKERRFVAQRDMLGKVFLVKDTLIRYNWQLVNETKKIGNYTCYKAIAKKKINRIESLSTTNNTSESSKPIEDEMFITAWYAPEIPISHGPSVFWGLPGLILEIHDGEQTMLCNKIVFNPKKALDIEEPKKGKIITESKFQEIMFKKAEEMKNLRSNRSDGNDLQIRIRG